jgi:hypothetical protein
MTIKIEQQLFENFKQFADLYRATVEKQYTDEVAIKMSEDEYNRFMENWRMYIDLMYVTRYNPIIRQEFEKVLIMVQLMR